MPLIDHVISTIKDGVDCRLGPCTVITRPNRGGKTAILDAIRVALGASHPIGRDGSLLQLVPEPELGLRSAVYGNGELLAEAVIDAGMRRAKFTRHVSLPGDDDLVVSSAEIEQLLSFGPARAREALCRRWYVTRAEHLEPPAELNEEQRGLWRVAATMRHEPIAVNVLSALSADFRGHARTPVDTSPPPTPPPAEQEITDARTRLDAIVVACANRMRARLLAGQAERLQSSLLESASAGEVASVWAGREQAARTRVDVAQTEYVRVQTLWAGSASNVQGVDVTVNARQIMLQRSDRTCICCGLQVDTLRLRSLLASGQDVQTAIHAEMASRHALLVAADAERTAARVDLEEVRQCQRLAAEAAAARQRQVEELATIRRVLREEGVSGEVHSASEDEAARHDAQTAYDTLLSRRTQAAHATAMVRREAEERRLAAVYRVLERVAARRQVEVLAEVVNQAVATVNKYMPAGFAAMLDLDERVCRWTVYGRDGAAHPQGAMSGAEESALRLGLLGAWAEGRPMRVLLLDDRDLLGLDPQNIAKTFEAVHAAVTRGDFTQAVVVWTRPNEVPHEGWTVVT